ncbi:MAG TPA: phage major capsid protein [Haliea salexigens]|uniref:Phage major capsid protein n=1 Tax=Haliea salexigens TaxID=287487 RepID=A0A3C1KM71_9GAMM|nr:phage major capsid protein [Haliea sp.]HAN27681.1 phage major capsid protein [Haliea salexigens]|tara:strand:- start:2306 stop:3313 length:1008 start_codon:yes stop_codon:yes gene_type:complete
MQIQKAGVLSDAARASRALVTTLLVQNHHEREADMERRWHWDAQRTKAAIGSFSSGDYNSSTSTSAEFMAHLVKQSVVAKIAPSTMRVEFNQPVNSPFSASAAWVPELHSIPVYSESLVNHSLPSRKVGAITVLTLEALEQANAEFALMAALSTACTEGMDTQFLNPDAVSSEAPPPITADAETIIAGSDPAASFRELLQNFRNLATSYLIMHPETAAHLSLITVNGAHVFPDIGVLGGTICGLPVICSQSAPLDSTGSTITLLDASRVLLAMGGVSISRTESASIELQDEIDSDGMGQAVSLFQSNAVAAKSLLFANWKLLDPDACRILVGANW